MEKLNEMESGENARYVHSKRERQKQKATHDYLVNKNYKELINVVFATFRAVFNWLVNKTRTTFSTNGKQNQNQSCFRRTRFPALGASHMYLLRILIGSLKPLYVLQHVYDCSFVQHNLLWWSVHRISRLTSLIFAVVWFVPLYMHSKKQIQGSNILIFSLALVWAFVFYRLAFVL